MRLWKVVSLDFDRSDLSCLSDLSYLSDLSGDLGTSSLVVMGRSRQLKGVMFWTTFESPSTENTPAWDILSFVKEFASQSKERVFIHMALYRNAIEIRTKGLQQRPRHQGQQVGLRYIHLPCGGSMIQSRCCIQLEQAMRKQRGEDT